MSTTIVPSDDSEGHDPIKDLAGSTPDGLAETSVFQVAGTLCVQLIDPVTKRIKATLDSVRDIIRTASVPPPPYVSDETGTSHSDKPGYEHVKYLDAVMNGHTAAGWGYVDQPAPPWLQAVGKWAVWFESLGILAYTTFIWNVDWFRPWTNPIPFITALVMVICLPLLQRFFAERAGHAHNSYRLNLHEDLETAAKRDKSKRNWYLAAALLVASIVTATVVIRGYVSLDVANWWEPAVVAGLAAVVGYGSAILAYAAVALDGSRYQRDRDSIKEQGEAYDADWTDDVTDAEEGLDEVENDIHYLKTIAFPKLLETVRQQGGSNQEENGTNLMPIIERARVVLALDDHRAGLEEQLQTVKANAPAFHLNG